MAKVSPQIFEKYRKGTIQELAQKPVRFGGYNTNTQMVDTVIYPSTLTASAIATGSQSISFSGQPLSPSAYSQFSYFPEYNIRPLVVSSSQSYPIINVLSANDGMSYAGASFGFQASDWIALVIKPSVAMAVTVRIKDSTGTANLSYTTAVLPANVFTPVRVPIAKFTRTGAFIYATGVKTIDFLGSAIGNFSTYDLEFANNDQCFVGSEIRESFDCYLDWNAENKRKIEKLMCFNYADGTINTSQDMSFKIKTAKVSHALEAMLEGQVLRNGNVNVRQYLDCPAVVSDMIPANVFQAGLEASAVSFTYNGRELMSVDSADQLVDSSQFLYNKTTGAVTFATGVLNGVKLQGSQQVKKQGTYYHTQNLGNSIYGCMDFGRITPTKEESTLVYRVQLADIKVKQTKSQVEYEFEFMVLPFDVVENGVLNKRLMTTAIL